VLCTVGGREQCPVFNRDLKEASEGADRRSDSREFHTERTAMEEACDDGDDDDDDDEGDDVRRRRLPRQNRSITEPEDADPCHKKVVRELMAVTL